MMRLRGIATEPIEFGAHVRVRLDKVEPATPEIANAIARDKPAWAHQTRYETGDVVFCQPIEGLGARNLQAIADGPIMESNRIYLPAGRLSEDQYQSRLDLQFMDAGIERP